MSDAVIVLFPDFDVDPDLEDHWSEEDYRREAMDQPPENEGKDLIERMIDLLEDGGIPESIAENIVLDLLDYLDWSK